MSATRARQQSTLDAFSATSRTITTRGSTATPSVPTQNMTIDTRGNIQGPRPLRGARGGLPKKKEDLRLLAASLGITTAGMTVKRLREAIKNKDTANKSRAEYEREFRELNAGARQTNSKRTKGESSRSPRDCFGDCKQILATTWGNEDYTNTGEHSKTSGGCEKL